MPKKHIIILLSVIFYFCENKKERFELPVYGIPQIKSKISSNGSIEYDTLEHKVQDFQLLNQNGILISNETFKNKIYVGIATHDFKLLEGVYRLIKELDVPKDMFEFQVLYGVPMSYWLTLHKKNNYKVRIYVPYGKDWHDYSIRRLKENPNILSYVLKNLFKKN